MLTPQRQVWFWEKVDKSGDCWEWTGARTRGYGSFHGDRTLRAHRVAFELVKGPIPDGLVLDHICRNTGCVNPEHLRAVTQAENVHASIVAVGAMNAKKTHCKYGHEFSPENIIRKKGSNTRFCRACKNRRHAEYKRRRRERESLEAALNAATLPDRQEPEEEK